MMKNKKQNRYNPRQYWKNKIEFDSKEELLIYQYLCGNIKKRNVKKINEKKRFQNYKTWREHIEEFLKKSGNDDLIEFYHFIKLEARYCDIDRGIHTQFAIPLSVAAVTGTFIPLLINPNTFKGIQTQQKTFIELVFLFIIGLFMMYICIGVIIWFLLYFLTDYVKSIKESAFWEDCLEIIEKEIKAREP